MASTFSFMRQRLYIGYAFSEGFVVNGIGKPKAEKIVKSDHRPGKLILFFFFFLQFRGSPQKRGQLPALLESTWVRGAHGPHLHRVGNCEGQNQEARSGSPDWMHRGHRFSRKNTEEQSFQKRDPRMHRYSLLAGH